MSSTDSKKFKGPSLPQQCIMLFPGIWPGAPGSAARKWKLLDGTSKTSQSHWSCWSDWSLDSYRYCRQRR